MIVPVDMTVSTAVPLKAPLVARTVSLPPPQAGAVYTPLELTVPPTPPESTDHANEGWLASACPNWSLAVAVSAWVVASATVALAGATAIAVSVCATVTVALLVAVSASGSAIVTWKV